MKEVDSDVIEVANLAKIYPNQKGVSGISFKVEKGEIMGLLGPNGAGKTTTMRLITGFLYPTAGTIKVGDYDIYENPREVRQQIGYLPETPPLYQEMSVQGYLTFAARLKGLKKSSLTSEVERVTEVTGLGDVTGQLISSLSKGYKQRVGLAQALLNSPPVLILDEPTIGLDPKQIIEFRNLIKGLAREHTVILSSHILPEVNAICGRVAIIDQGHLVAIDTSEGLSDQLKNGQRVRIEAKGERENVEKMLASVREVENIAYLGTAKVGTDETFSFELQGQKEAGDIREKIFKTFAAGNVPLLEMQAVNLSLEDIFLELTTKEELETEITSEEAVIDSITNQPGEVGVANE